MKAFLPRQTAFALVNRRKSKERCIFPEKADDIEKGRVVRPFFCLMGWYQLPNRFCALM